MIKVKEKKGFTTADIVISIIVIMIFVGMIVTLFYNFYLTTSAKNRNSIATNYLIDVIEEIKSMNYEEVQPDSNQNNTINEMIKNLEVANNIPQQYQITGEIQKYNELEENTNKKDLVKILTVRVEYRIGKKIEKIEISTLLTNNVRNP